MGKPGFLSASFMFLVFVSLLVPKYDNKYSLLLFPHCLFSITPSFRDLLSVCCSKVSAVLAILLLFLVIYKRRLFSAFTEAAFIHTIPDFPQGLHRQCWGCSSCVYMVVCTPTSYQCVGTSAGCLRTCPLHFVPHGAPHTSSILQQCPCTEVAHHSTCMQQQQLLTR